MGKFIWNHSRDIAIKDCTTLKQWERGDITTDQAIEQLAEHNRCPAPSKHEFLDMVSKLGYYRERFVDEDE